MFDYLFDVSSQPKVAIPKLFFLTLHPSNLSHPFDNGIINHQSSIINHQKSTINNQSSIIKPPTSHRNRYALGSCDGA
ncbi:MAG: hypothetical protein MSA08_08985, partial [Prevotella sp.]|nr:hypothetical protein [Prevotella sp.]